MKRNFVNVMGMAVCGIACMLLVMASVPGRTLAEEETLITIKSGETFNNLAGEDCTEINFHPDYAEPLPQGTAYDADGAGTIVGVKTGTVLDIYCQDGIALDEDCSYMFGQMTELTAIGGLSQIGTSSVTNMRGMFSSCESLTALDLSGFDTSNATDMCGLFFSCHSLTDVDLSGFDTSKVTITNAMFCDCLSMKTIDVSSFDMSKVTDMGWMFGTNTEYAEDTHLEKVILGTISAPAAETVMHCMFYGDTKLNAIELDGCDTSKATNMSAMFCDCKALTEIDLSGFNTANVTDMSYMFAGCESLKELDLAACDVSKVEDMSAMFINCYNLEVLDISTWKTPALTLMSSKVYPADIEYSADGSLYEGMFEHCRALKTLDLSGFDTSKVTEATESFNDCPNLKTVKTGAGWTLTGILPATPAAGDYAGSLAVYALALAASLAAAGISIGIVIRFNKICYAEK